MITNADKQAAEAFVRGEPMPAALEYSMMVELASNQMEHVMWLRKIGAASSIQADAQDMLTIMFADIERLKNQNGGRIPT